MTSSATPGSGILEGLGVTPVVERLRVRWNECFFWATRAGAELDLLVVRGRTRIGFEFETTQAKLPRRCARFSSDLRNLKCQFNMLIHALHPTPTGGAGVASGAAVAVTDGCKSNHVEAPRGCVTVIDRR